MANISMADTFDDDESDEAWVAGYATPPQDTRSPQGSMASPDDEPPTFNMVQSSPTSPASPPSPSSPVAFNTPCRGLNFERHRSFLKVTGMPRTPRSLLQQTRILDEEEDKPFTLPNRLRASDSTRPSTAPDLGRGLQVPRPSNVNPFTPAASRSSKRPASPDLDEQRDAPPGGGMRAMRTRSNSIFGSPTKNLLERPSGPGDGPSRGRSPAPKNDRQNIHRYAEEFEQISELGSGEFGTVMKCKFRIDGTFYAIKRSKKPISGLAEEQQLLREVYAHAVISEQPHIVRYYSAWKEDNHMLIQNEYCDGGSIEDEIKRRHGRPFSEEELLRIFRHVGEGLRCLHAKKLVHMDIKPGNIFIKTEDVSPLSPIPAEDDAEVFTLPEVGSPTYDASPMDLGFNSGGRNITSVPEEPRSVERASNSAASASASASSPEPEDAAAVTYKIGDLGLVTGTDDPNIEEGDCRYMPKELLDERYGHLPKADIFALGITIHEVASGKELPKNGEHWHKLRDGEAPHMPKYSAELNHLIEICLHPKPEMRPSATEILKHPALVTGRSLALKEKSKEQIWSELSATKMQNSQLLRQLAEERKKPRAIGMPISRRNSAPAPRRKRAGSMQW